MGFGLLQVGVLTGKSHIASSSEIAKIACYTLCKTLQCPGIVLEVLLRCLQPKLVLVLAYETNGSTGYLAPKTSGRKSDVI